jgi:hypothetical protein
VQWAPVQTLARSDGAHCTRACLSPDGLVSFPGLYEADGTTVAKKITQGTEQDTFSAHGKTLVGDSYHFMFQALYENGERVALYANGNAERVPLPSGGVFISTGRVLVTATPSNIFFVDSGNNANNIAAFCAALS